MSDNNKNFCTVCNGNSEYILFIGLDKERQIHLCKTCYNKWKNEKEQIDTSIDDSDFRECYFKLKSLIYNLNDDNLIINKTIRLIALADLYNSKYKKDYFILRIKDDIQYLLNTESNKTKTKQNTTTKSETQYQKNTINENIINFQYLINNLDSTSDEFTDSIDKLNNIIKYMQLLKNDIDEKINKIQTEISEQQKEINYENIHSLYTFDSYISFKNFCFDLYKINKWQISYIDETERIATLESRPYFQKLKNDFNSKNICPHKITNSEVLSYLDSLSILYKILENVQNKDFKKNVKIIMEYVPNNDTGRDRCDYVLAYKNILILFEFGKCKDKFRIKEFTIDKETKLSYYESQIKKLVSNDIIIKKHAIIYQPEKDDKTIEENFKAINNASLLIKKWLKESYKNAIDYLNEDN